MAATVGYQGIVTSWAGTPFDVTKFSPATVNFSVDGDEFDATVLAASLEAMSYVSGLKSWAVQMSGRFPAAGAKTGANGLVTLSGYDTLIRAYTLQWSGQEFDSTVFNASGVVWRSFVPGIYGWRGTFEGLIDDTTALGLPPVPDASAGSLTLKLLEDGSPDRTFTGSARVRQTSGVVNVGGLNTAQFAYTGTGALTATGTNNLWASGAITKAASGSLVFQAASGRTYTGDAFLTQMSLSCPVDGLIDVSLTARGTGALTPA